MSGNIALIYVLNLLKDANKLRLATSPCNCPVVKKSISLHFQLVGANWRFILIMSFFLLYDCSLGSYYRRFHSVDVILRSAFGKVSLLVRLSCHNFEI